MKNFYLNYLLFFAFFLLSIKPYSQTIIQEINRLSATDRALADQLGYKVAMSGDFAIVAAPFQDYNINGENFMEIKSSMRRTPTKQPSKQCGREFLLFTEGSSFPDKPKHLESPI